MKDRPGLDRLPVGLLEEACVSLVGPLANISLFIGGLCQKYEYDKDVKLRQVRYRNEISFLLSIQTDLERMPPLARQFLPYFPSACCDGVPRFDLWGRAYASSWEAAVDVNERFIQEVASVFSTVTGKHGQGRLEEETLQKCWPVLRSELIARFPEGFEFGGLVNALTEEASRLLTSALNDSEMRVDGMQSGVSWLLKKPEAQEDTERAP